MKVKQYISRFLRLNNTFKLYVIHWFVILGIWGSYAKFAIDDAVLRFIFIVLSAIPLVIYNHFGWRIWKTILGDRYEG